MPDLVVGGEATSEPVAQETPQAATPTYQMPMPLELPPEHTDGVETAAPEYFIESAVPAPDGTRTVYRTREEAAAGIAAKDLYIAEQKALLAARDAQLQELIRTMRTPQQQAPAAPQVDPLQQAYDQAFRYYTDELNLDDNSARKLAQDKVETIRMARQEAMNASQQVLRQQYAQQFEAIRANDPSFDVEQNELVRTIFVAHGDKGPQYCYDLYKRYAGQSGVTSATPQAPMQVVSPQVTQAQNALSAQRASSLDGLRSRPATSGVSPSYPPEVQMAIQKAIAQEPVKSKDPAWVNKITRLTVEMHNRARGFTPSGGYK